MNEIDSKVPFGTLFTVINNRMTTPEGHKVMSPYIDRPGYIQVADLEQMEREGAITIHSKGGNGLAESYGRMTIIYSVNA